MRKLPLMLVLAGALVSPVTGAGSALAGDADREIKANRYIMKPVEGGFLRMDTQSGILSFCRIDNSSGNGITCRLADDDRVALMREMDKLRKQVKELKEENKRLEDMLLGDNKTGPGVGERKRTFKLPSEEDVDKALGYIERMYKKFRDKIRELEKESKSNRSREGDNGSGTGTPL